MPAAVKNRRLPLPASSTRRPSPATAAAALGPDAPPPTRRPGHTYVRRTRAVREPAPDVCAVPVPSASPGPRPIVVATADPALSRMLAFALDQARLPHVRFQSGSVVLRELLAMPTGPHPTIVVLDVDLPGVDGHAILERLGVERPDTFMIVVLSSHADESMQVRSLLAGALDHLAKPFNVRVLTAKLQRWAAIAAREPVTP